MKFKTVTQRQKSTFGWDKGKEITWYHLYVKKYWFSFIWRKCGYGLLDEADNKKKEEKYRSGAYKMPDLAAIQKIKSLPTVFKNTWICIKYPFLWPRNRFSGLHYNNTWMSNLVCDLNKKAYVYLGKIGDEENPYRMETKNILYSILYDIVKWVYENPVQWVHCFTSYTELDAMPEGWLKAFGLQMCEEVKKGLLKDGGLRALFSYRITDIKEKWGYLHWYDVWSTSSVMKVISKYEKISEKTCIVCGKPAKYITTSWVAPYCEEHLPETDKYQNSFTYIDEKVDKN